MAVTYLHGHEKALISAVPDVCRNYKPTDKKTVVRSVALPVIYECSNLDGGGCLVCRKRTDEQGEFMNQNVSK